MFIARSNPHLSRRSEEREAWCVLRASSFPLLRTVSWWRLGGGYKHATPNGVKKPSYLVVITNIARLNDRIKTKL